MSATTLPTRPHRFWLIVSLWFPLAVAAVPLIYHFTRLHPKPSTSAIKLADRLCKRFPGARVIPDGCHDDLEDGCYITTTNKTRRELAAIPRLAEAIEQWQGTVHVCRVNAAEMELHFFGSHYLIDEPYLIFGDAEMLGVLAGR
jgi:hypothetical protein